MSVRPILSALVLADHVYIDRTTGKKVIAGTFNRFVSREFPATSTTRKYAFASMTDVVGKVAITFRYVDLENNDVLLEVPNLTAQSNDRLATVEMVVEIPPLPMPHPGAYAFEAYFGEELIGSLRLQVLKRSEEESAE